MKVALRFALSVVALGLVFAVVPNNNIGMAVWFAAAAAIAMWADRPFITGRVPPPPKGRRLIGAHGVATLLSALALWLLLTFRPALHDLTDVVVFLIVLAGSVGGIFVICRRVAASA